VIRSAWIQSTLNYEGMQNLGRLFALVPVARWLRLNRDEMTSFTTRHLSYFNSNPFVATLGLGALARIEVDNRETGGPEEGLIERMSMRLSAPLGAVGDKLFWASIRPQAALLGILVALFWGIWGAAAYIACFAVWSAVYRWLCFQRGWDLGLSVARAFKAEWLRKPGLKASWIASAVAGFILVVLAGWSTQGDGAPYSIVVFILAGVSAAVWVSGERRPTWTLVLAMGWVAVVSALRYLFTS
jgi:mannose/fructose/N-acetylgalactosamine-specific phosphotransferase system component IID